eukprot:294328-Pleurochrysis_carterae.AAC.2
MPVERTFVDLLSAMALSIKAALCMWHCDPRPQSPTRTRVDVGRTQPDVGAVLVAGYTSMLALAARAK